MPLCCTTATSWDRPIHRASNRAMRLAGPALKGRRRWCGCMPGEVREETGQPQARALGVPVLCLGAMSPPSAASSRGIPSCGAQTRPIGVGGDTGCVIRGAPVMLPAPVPRQPTRADLGGAAPVARTRCGPGRYGSHRVFFGHRAGSSGRWMLLPLALDVARHVSCGRQRGRAVLALLRPVVCCSVKERDDTRREIHSAMSPLRG